MTNLMLPHVRSVILVCCCILCFAPNGADAQEKDRIFPIKGSQVTGKIIEKTRDRVVIEVRGNNQNFNTIDIARIIYDGEPQSLSRTRDLTNQGQYDQAVEEYKKIVPGSLTTDDMKQDHQYYRGYLAGALSLRGKGDPANAAKLLAAWAKDNKNAPQFYAAMEQLGHLELVLGHGDVAAKYFGTLSGAPFPELQLKGNYYQGKAQLSQKLTAEAKAKFQAVIAANLADAPSLRLQKLAKVSVVKCDAADGKVDEAIAALEKMVDENDSNDGEIFADIYNSMGSILTTASRNEEAILAYLKTYLLYQSQPDSHAEALYYLSQLWPKVGENARATEYKARLTKLYPTSTWAKK